LNVAAIVKKTSPKSGAAISFASWKPWRLGDGTRFDLRMTGGAVLIDSL
jgi:hypothetical protein